MENAGWTTQERRLLAAIVQGDQALRWFVCLGESADDFELGEAIAGLQGALRVYELLGWPTGRRHRMLVGRAEDLLARLRHARRAEG